MTPTDWLIPEWPAPAGVHAVFTTRAGGFSKPPWDSFNLGDHVGDVIQHVDANRALLEQTITSHPVFLRQIHGASVECINLETLQGTVADACMTSERGLACTIMVADCLPVLLTNAAGSMVAAVHAGWRGLAGVDSGGKLGEKGVLETVLSAFEGSKLSLSQSIYARDAPEIIAWLGPCIGPTTFEVGAEVKACFEAGQPDAGQFFKATAPSQSQEKYLADLAGLARARLKALGITQIYGNDSSAAWCTVGNPSRFFSHRRDARGVVQDRGNGFNTTGRMAACIWLS